MIVKLVLLLLIFGNFSTSKAENGGFIQRFVSYVSGTTSAIPKQSLLQYDKISRRFYFDRGQDEAESRSKKVRARPQKEVTSFFDSVIDFFTGGFFSDFTPPMDRKPPSKNKKNNMKKPQKQESFLDLIDNFLDGMDDLFGAPFRNEESSEENSSEKPESPASSSSWFNWFRTEDTSDSSQSQSEEDVEDEEEDSANAPSNKVEGSGIVIKIEHKTKTQTPKPATTVKIVKITTEKPITTTTPKQKKTTVYSHRNKLTFVESKKKTPTTPPTIRLSSRRPNNVIKNEKDCNGKKPSSWFPQMFESTNSIEQTTEKISETTTKPPEGWFSFLTTLEDEENVNETTESPLNWFTSFFNIETSTKASVPIIMADITSTTTTTTASTETNWFDSFLNIEEDDAAYLVNKTDSRKKGKRKTYIGSQLIRLHPNNLWKVKDLKKLQEDTQGSGLMWWSTPALNRSADLLVPRGLLADVKDHLNEEGIEYDVIIWDLQKAIAYENPKLSKTQRLELESVRGHPLTWRRYHRYADILRYMEYLSLKYPEMVELIPLGRSSEGMPLVVAKVFFPQNKSDNSTGPKKKWKLRSKMKPAIWIDGGMHAREWISPAVATWILHSLVEGEKGNGADTEMLRMADWYIMPVVNPDGYEFTHTRDRLWRKTRSVRSNSDVYFNGWFPWNWGNMECMGVDLNRNWDYHWGERGSSNDPCSEYYAGPYPFSEPETKAVSSFLMDNKDQMKVYLSLHSYAQMWIMPSTHSREPFVDNAELLEMGKLAIDALSEMSGTKYEIGSMKELLQPTTGTANDWAKGRAGIKYAYTVKMRDSQGPHGFLLPGSQITATAKETWEAIKAIADNI